MGDRCWLLGANQLSLLRKSGNNELGSPTCHAFSSKGCGGFSCDSVRHLNITQIGSSKCASPVQLCPPPGSNGPRSCGRRPYQADRNARLGRETRASPKAPTLRRVGAEGNRVSFFPFCYHIYHGDRDRGLHSSTARMLHPSDRRPTQSDCAGRPNEGYH